MKKCFALILALAMLLSLAACGGSSAPAATQAPAPSVPAPTEAPAPAEEPAQEPAAEEEDAPTFGVYDPEACTYTNEFLGFVFRVGDTWTVLDREELAQFNDVLAEMVSDEKLSETLADSGSFHVFYATDDEIFASVDIVMENLGLLYGAVLSEEKYIELSKDDLAPALESIGIDDVTVETATFSFVGEEHPGLTVHGTMEGIDMYESIVLLKVGRYMAVIAVSSYIEDFTRDILAEFHSL